MNIKQLVRILHFSSSCYAAFQAHAKVVYKGLEQYFLCNKEKTSLWNMFGKQNKSYCTRNFVKVIFLRSIQAYLYLLRFSNFLSRNVEITGFHSREYIFKNFVKSACTNKQSNLK